MLQLGTAIVLPIFDLDSEPAHLFSFLLEFTKDLSLPHSFENAIEIRDSMPVADGLHLQGQLGFYDADHDLFNLDGCSSGFEDGASLWSMSSAPRFPDHTFGEASVAYIESASQKGEYLWGSDALEVKIDEIMRAVGERINNMQPANTVGLLGRADPTQSRCLDFFSSPQLRRYLDMYWEKWYPNWPTIHRPLFNPLQRSALLVAAMAVIGACHSTDPNERVAAHSWADAVEQWASRELERLPLSGSMADRSNNLQVIQAACIICIYQNWNGALESKRRMRRGFFSAIVGVR